MSTGAGWMIKQTTGKLLEEKVVLDIEGIDWYLNLYQPMLRTGGGVATFFREEQEHRGAKVASTALMNPMTKSFVQEIHDFAKGQRKDEVTQERLAKFSGQDKDPVHRQGTREIQYVPCQ